MRSNHKTAKCWERCSNLSSSFHSLASQLSYTPKWCWVPQDTHNIDEQDKTGTQVTEEKSGVQLEYNIP